MKDWTWYVQDWVMEVVSAVVGLYILFCTLEAHLLVTPEFVSGFTERNLVLFWGNLVITTSASDIYPILYMGYTIASGFLLCSAWGIWTNMRSYRLRNRNRANDTAV